MFNTNNEYARKYDEWRRKEELVKLKAKYGDDIDDDDESSSSSESEDDPMLTNPKLQEDWLKTLEALKNKDPKIYQKDYHFFTEPNEEDEDSDSEPKPEKKKEKPMYLKDYERKVILEKGGIISSDEEDFEPDDVKTYNQEQEELRQEFVQAATGLDNDSDNDDGFGGGLFVKRKRTVDEIQAEEKDQEEWMKQHEQSTKKVKREEIGIEAEPLGTKDISSIEDRQEFLRNYILGQSYLEKDKSRIPTYDEVVYDENEVEEDKQNFRSEEFGSTEVKTFPRGNKHLIRQKDNKRAEKRTAIKERKRQEKDKKKEELKRLKNLKRQEILAKIEKLKEVTGNDSLGFNEDDIEGDFDPDHYDQMMEKQFNDDYYAAEAGDVEKPVFEVSDEEDYGENLDEWSGVNDPDNAGADNYDYAGPHVDDPDFCMDADYDPTAPKPMSRKKMKRLRNKKNKHKLIDMLEQKKPLFNPDEKSFESYLDDYYNLDFEDIIDDIPCRFKYRKVTPYTYGLTEDEILNSDEKELDAWVKLKRINKYRTEEGDKQHIEGFEKRARNKKLKKRVLISLYQPPEDKEEKGAAETEEGKSKKKKRKKGKKFKRDRPGANTDDIEMEVNPSTSSVSQDSENRQDQNTESQSENSGKKKKKSKMADDDRTLEKSEKQFVKQVNESVKNKSIDGGRKDGCSKKKRHKQRNISEERLKAYGLDPKTIKYAKEGRFSYKYKQKK